MDAVAIKPMFEGASTIGDLLEILENYEFSSEFLNVMKEAMELDLMDYYIEAHEFALENADIVQDGYLTEHFSVPDHNIDVLYEQAAEAKKRWYTRLWEGILKIVGAIKAAFGRLLDVIFPSRVDKRQAAAAAEEEAKEQQRILDDATPESLKKLFADADSPDIQLIKDGQLSATVKRNIEIIRDKAGEKEANIYEGIMKTLSTHVEVDMPVIYADIPALSKLVATLAHDYKEMAKDIDVGKKESSANKATAIISNLGNIESKLKQAKGTRKSQWISGADLQKVIDGLTEMENSIKTAITTAKAKAPTDLKADAEKFGKTKTKGGTQEMKSAEGKAAAEAFSKVNTRFALVAKEFGTEISTVVTTVNEIILKRKKNQTTINKILANKAVKKGIAAAEGEEAAAAGGDTDTEATPKASRRRMRGGRRRSA